MDLGYATTREISSEIALGTIEAAGHEKKAEHGHQGWTQLDMQGLHSNEFWHLCFRMDPISKSFSNVARKVFISHFNTQGYIQNFC